MYADAAQQQHHIEDLANVFQSPGDTTRLGIVRLLMRQNRPLCVNAIVRQSGVSQSAVSQQLNILRLQGLVLVKKEGNYRHYTVNHARLAEILDLRVKVLGDGYEWLLQHLKAWN
ncbi:MAG: helix-turn-helix transcriptional regulator [Spirochaetales bacterium]|nr:helix-turn-helix transcriptional regulator [Spirochaetales bacterium]